MNNNSDELALSTGMQYRNIDYAKRARRIKREGSIRKLGDKRSLSMPDLGAQNRKLIEELKAQCVALKSVDLSDPEADMTEAREMLSSTRDSFNDIMRRKNHLRSGHPMKAAGDQMTAQELHPATRKSDLTHERLVAFGQATNYSHPLLDPR